MGMRSLLINYATFQGSDEDESRHRLRGQEREFDFANATYEHEGLWRCVASNMIKGGTETTTLY